MKIFILADQLKLHGGIEKLISIKANYWADIFKYNVTLITTNQQSEDFIYNINNSVRHIDLEINYIDGVSYFKNANLKNVLTNTRKLRSIIALEKPDFILVASHIPATYILPFIKGSSKIIKEFHYSKWQQSKSSIKDRLLEKIEKLYDFRVVLSSEEQQFYPKENTVVIANPVSFRHDNPLPISKREKVAIAVLRFAPVKQIEKMVEVWELFIQKFPTWKLKIYGTTGNDYFMQIRNLVNIKNLGNHIVFCGATDNVSQVLASARVLLLTSINECLPMVILEGQTVGTPTISFDSPTGPRNIINDQIDGVIIPLNDKMAFVRQLEKVAEDDFTLQKWSDNAIINSKNYQLDHIMEIWKQKIFNATTN